jgi:uncharacterized protein YuzE
MGGGLGEDVKIEYDAVGDTLYLDSRPPQDAQVLREVEPGVFLRLDSETGEILGIEVHRLQRRAASPDGVESRIAAAFTVDFDPLERTIPKVATVRR